jgi:hypothetical protein
LAPAVLDRGFFFWNWLLSLPFIRPLAEEALTCGRSRDWQVRRTDFRYAHVERKQAVMATGSTDLNERGHAAATRFCGRQFQGQKVTETI